MDLGLDGNVYIVSGATRGLGRAAAEVLVAEGARVVISGRDPHAVLAAATDLRTDRALGVVADNADPTTPERLVASAMARYGRLDGALISVGGPPAGGVDDVTDEQWRESFETVFLGAIRLARGVARGLADRGGSIAFVLSSTVHEPIRGLIASTGLRPGLAMVHATPAAIKRNARLPTTNAISGDTRGSPNIGTPTQPIHTSTGDHATRNRIADRARPISRPSRLTTACRRARVTRPPGTASTDIRPQTIETNTGMDANPLATRPRSASPPAGKFAPRFALSAANS